MASRAARKEAVCGHKPGGADAYYLKETCVLKEHDHAQKKVTRANLRITEKASVLLEFAKVDLRRVLARQRAIRASGNIRAKALFQRGADSIIAQNFLHSKDKSRTVHSRMLEACDTFNKRFKADEVLSPVLEFAALASVVIVYSTIINGLA